MFNEIFPELVIHLAAETDVDRSEQEPKENLRLGLLGLDTMPSWDEAFWVNVLRCLNMVKTCESSS